MRLIACDIGFGETKVFTALRALKFPSHYHQITGEGIQVEREQRQSANAVREWEGRKYFVGYNAKSYSSQGIQDIEGLITFAPLFVLEALKQLDIQEPVIIATGLPLEYYQKSEKYNHHDYRADMVKRIKKSLGELIEDVYVYPQGLGVLVGMDADANIRIAEIKASFNGDAEAEIARTDHGFRLNSAVVDIGENTIDIIVTESGRTVREECSCSEGYGIERLLNKVGATVHSLTGMLPSAKEEIRIFRTKEVTVLGKHYDLKNTIDDLTRNYIIEITNLVKKKVSYGRFQRIRYLILAGGGAYYIKDLNNSKLDPIIRIPERPEYANVKGFYLMAQNAGAKKEKEAITERS
jgi:hypothetical protein